MSDTAKVVDEKIVALEVLPLLLAPSRSAGKKIMHCHGVFDLLHIGHIRYLKQSRALGDLLVVTITADAFVNKGPGRPEFAEGLRAEALAALDCVDFVAVNRAASAVPAIELIKPDLHLKGLEYEERLKDPTSKLHQEKAAVEKFGGKLRFIDDIQFSSSHLLNKYFVEYPPAIKKYLEDLRLQFSVNQVLTELERLKQLKVLVIGETIIDHYHNVEAIGKAGKEPVLVTRSHEDQKYIGGSLAIANHIAGFAGQVKIISCLGDRDDYREFIDQRLRATVKTDFITLTNRPTIRKLRYLDHYLLQKLFEVYFIDDDPLIGDEEQRLLKAIEEQLAEYDLVVVADYGHGMISPKAIELLTKQAKFLAVNTQVNAGNRGMHTISRYPKADYISLSQGELQMDLRVRHDDVDAMINIVKRKVRCPWINITQGKKGITTFCEGREAVFGPGFAQTFIDRIGSGDAVLALTSMLACNRVPPEILVFLGNLAGSEAVKTVGHSSFMDFDSLKRTVTAILK